MLKTHTLNWHKHSHTRREKIPKFLRYTMFRHDPTHVLSTYIRASGTLNVGTLEPLTHTFKRNCTHIYLAQGQVPTLIGAVRVRVVPIVPTLSICDDLSSLSCLT